MQKTGVELAIAELQKEVRTINDAISTLGRFHPLAAIGAKRRKTRRRLSKEARLKMSEAAKERWAALKSAKKK